MQKPVVLNIKTKYCKNIKMAKV